MRVQLDVLRYTIRRAGWYVTGKEWKIDNVLVNITTFVIKPGCELTSNVHNKCEIRVVCQVLCFVSFLSS